MAISYTKSDVKKFPNMDILLDYDELHYELDHAIENGDLEEAKELRLQLKAYENRWSLTCSSTSLQA